LCDVDLPDQRHPRALGPHNGACANFQPSPHVPAHRPLSEWLRSAWQRCMCGPVVRRAACRNASCPFPRDCPPGQQRAHSLRRFYRRAEATDDPVHVEAQQMVDLAGGPPELEAMYERLVDLLDARPRARVLRTQSGEVDRAYYDFVSQLT
jgi:hypothetical protein